MADNKSTENARKQLEANRAAQAEAREKGIVSTVKVVSAEGSKPTPTQEENDLAKLGAHLTEHEPDGSPETGPTALVQTPGVVTEPRSMEARRSPTSGYSTRAVPPAKND